jgi:Phosphopantetheine attachment site.
MEINEFVKNFANQFDETDASEFTPATDFRQLDEWSSLIALSVIAMIDEEYDVVIKGDDVKSSKTIQDLFEIVKSRKKS